MSSLTGLPNIGKVLAQKLTEAGIDNFEKLKTIGAEATLLRIRKKDNTACFNMLCALEGAIQGVRWHNLPHQRKEELKNFLRMSNIPLSPLNK